ncbi:phosphoinositide 3-kinase regulatory subunit 6 [Platysternon megacephalum]|uniref:Phosphoinositide 3-kinase regulatory subunit 6 n=1 Tax=Platysternon megacephalum TaxID=55544 RepID=A0A4D9DQR2_9SAUR|nr:phosphoinositide 3-kinase regulatory subunit 6 [Platysternon megacephalum]
MMDAGSGGGAESRVGSIAFSLEQLFLQCLVCSGQLRSLCLHHLIVCLKVGYLLAPLEAGGTLQGHAWQILSFQEVCGPSKLSELGLGQCSLVVRARIRKQEPSQG